MKRAYLTILYALAMAASAFAQPIYVGVGCTTAYHIDKDCDGYGVGTIAGDPNPLLGPDADDNDATVHTAAQGITLYGSMSAFLNHLEGFTPSGIWYVSLAGNDSTCALNNPALPCKTWYPGVYSHYSAGQAVLWRGGTWTYSSGQGLYSGTGSAQNLFMAYPGEAAILDFSAANSDGLSIGGLQYLTIDGFHLKGGYSGYGINYTSYTVEQGLVIKNVEISSFYDSLVLWTAGSGTIVTQSVIGPLSPGGEHNIYATGHPSTATNLSITGNIILDPGAGGGHNIHYNGAFVGSAIQGNIMYNSLNQCVAYQNGVAHSLMENNLCFSGSHNPIFIWDYDQISENDILALDQNYNVFRNNTFYYTGTDYTTGAVNCATGVHWIRDDSQCKFRTCNNNGSGAGGCVANGGSCAWNGSIVACTGGTQAGCAGGACCSWSNPTNASHDLGHNTYDNNIFMAACPSSLNNMQMQYDTDGNGAGGASWLGTDIWRNNLFFSTNTGGGYYHGFLELGQFDQGVTPTYRTYAQFLSAAGTAANNAQGNPLPVAADPAWYNTVQQFNLRVGAGSPAIGTGLGSDCPATDVTGAARSTCDIGAYAYSPPTPPSCLITTSSLPGGLTGVAYSATVATSGCAAPAFSISVGSLPTGLSINASTGVIGGTPSGTTESFTVAVADANGNPTEPLSITITTPVVCTITTTSLPNGTIGTAYSQTVGTTGCAAPAFSVSAGALPTGLSIDGSTGVISGTPSAGGAFSFTAAVADANGNPTEPLSITILAPCTITTSLLPNGFRGAAYSQPITTSGCASPTFSVSAGSLPTGLAIGSPGPSYVAGSGASCINAESGYSCTATSAIAAANLVFVAAALQTGADCSGVSFSVTDSASNVYTPIGPMSDATAYYVCSQVFYTHAARMAATVTATYDNSGAGFRPFYAGVAQASGVTALDAGPAAAFGVAGATPTSAAFSTTVANEIIFSAIADYYQADAVAAGTGYTLAPGTGASDPTDGYLQCAIEYKIVSAKQTAVTAPWVVTGTGYSNVSVGTFQGLAGGTISGVPTAAGASSFTVAVTDPNGNPTEPLSITVLAPGANVLPPSSVTIGIN